MKIAITRLKEKGSRDAALCRQYGHECFTVSPLAARMYPDRIRDFASGVNRGEYDCLFFTSALPAQAIGPLLTRWPRVIAIGPQTARTLKGFGIEAETLPSFYSRDFAPYMGDWLKDRRVGIPRADVPNAALLESIRSRGGIPHEIRVYGLLPTGENLPVGDADAIIFTSTNSFKEAVWEKQESLVLVAIGEITAEAMNGQGSTPDVVGDGSMDGTLRAIKSYLESKSRDPARYTE